jgi:bacteriorhodopsin
LRFSRGSKPDGANELPSSLTEGSTELTKEISMFITLFAVLLVLWLLGFFAFHVTSGLIHLLLIVAVISLVIHFFRGRSAD